MLKRQEEFQKLGLGLFIHYGLYSKFAKGEWYWNMYHLTETQYYSQVGKNFKLKADFNKIAKWAKVNDFGYIVLTAKHHDGFALYDSKDNSKYDINWLNNKKDIIREYINACINVDIKPFIYYATMDWLDPKQSFNDHLKNIYNNIELLLKEYGEKIAGFWFDGNWSEPNKDWQLDQLYNMIRHYNPNAIITNNTGLENKGITIHKEIDVTTYEQGSNNFTSNLLIPFESVYPIIDHWGNSNFDFNFKSLPKLINDFIKVRINGGNLLLNIGLNANGEIQDLERATIEKFHEWSQATNYWWKEPIKLLYIQPHYWLYGSNKPLDAIRYNDYLILTNIKSGAHIDNIHYGNQEGNEKCFWVGQENIKKMFYLDNLEKIVFTINNGWLYYKPKSFEYGYNTISRFIKIVKEKKEK